MKTVFIIKAKQLDPLASAFRAKGWKVIRRKRNSHAPLGLDLYIAWNGTSYLNEAYVDKWKESGGRIIYAEWGWLPQRAGIYLDSCGCAAKSSLMGMDLSKPIGRKEIRQTQQFINLYKTVCKKGQWFTWIDEPFIFIPLQLEIDAQIVQFTPVKNMTEFLDIFKDWNQCPIYVKPHPAQAKLVGDVPRHSSYWIRTVSVGTDLGNLIDRSSLVITLNSCVGIEAIARGKKVMAFGESFYGREDLVEIGNFENPIPYIKRSLNAGIPNHIIDKRMRFLHKLYKRQLTPDIFNNPGIIDRILNGVFERP